MKSNNISLSRISYLIIAAFILSFNAAHAQCEKKDFCSDDWTDDYDFRSQSSFAKLAPGDTSSVSFVLYSNQRYRIYVCSDPKVGNVSWKVVNPERKTKRTILTIKKDTTVVFKYNENGDIMTDANGKSIVLSRNVAMDTLWKTDRIAVDKVVFDNKTAGDKPYYDIIPQKTERYIARISVPAGDPNISGCVNIYVGRAPINSKNFNKSSKNSRQY